MKIRTFKIFTDGGSYMRQAETMKNAIDDLLEEKPKELLKIIAIVELDRGQEFILNRMDFVDIKKAREKIVARLGELNEEQEGHSITKSDFILMDERNLTSIINLRDLNIKIDTLSWVLKNCLK